jgi:hypothetical protein
MALILEDGSGVAGANTYALLTTVNDYHSALGNDEWFLSTNDPTAAILRAMAWLESQSWKGYKIDYDNALAWPRGGVVDSDGYSVPSDEIPSRVINALCEAAIAEVSTPGSLRPVLKRGGQIASVSVHGAVSVTYKDNAPAETRFMAIQGYLRGLTHSTNIFRVELA